MQVALLLLLGASASSGLDEDVERYVDASSPRFSRHGLFVSAQLNVWMPVAEGDVTVGGTRFDLRRDLDMGVIEEGYTGLVVPAVGSLLGLCAFSASPGSPDSIVVAAFIGAGCAVALATSILDAPIDFVLQWNWREFGVRADMFFLDYDDEGSAVAPSQFDASHVRVLGSWTVWRTEREGIVLDHAKPVGAALSLVGGIARVEVESRVGDDAGDVRTLMPQIGVLFEARTNDWGFDVQVTGGAFDGDVWWDARASAMWGITECFGLRMGYRILGASVSDGGFEWDGLLHGFYFGASFHF